MSEQSRRAFLATGGAAVAAAALPALPAAAEASPAAWRWTVEIAAPIVLSPARMLDESEADFRARVLSLTRRLVIVDGLADDEIQLPRG